jgi:hypothetical protein
MEKTVSKMEERPRKTQVVEMKGSSMQRLKKTPTKKKNFYLIFVLTCRRTI